MLLALPPVPETILFMALVLMLSLYGLTLAGHFPEEHRAASLRSLTGAAVLWGSMGLAIVIAVTTAMLAWQKIPLYAAIIGGGAMLLAAPLILQPFPDSFVNGRRGLLILIGLAAILAIAARAL